MLQTFWWTVTGLVVVVTVKGYGQAPQSWIGASLIIAASLLPIYLWITGRVMGLPIFPLYALTFIWIYGLPLISEHPIVRLFPPSYQLTAALSITGFLVVGTGAWYLVARRPSKQPVICWMLDERGLDPVLIAILAVAFVLTLTLNAGWINVPQGVYTILRAVMLAAEALICFVLSYRVGGGTLSPGMKTVFFLLVGGISIINFTSLLLIGSMSLLGLSVIAYTVASRKPPWFLCVLAIGLFSLLHYGKGPMREKYWREEENFVLSPLKYPSFFAEWMQTSWRMLTAGDEDDQTESLVERASLMHLMLYIQAMTPDNLPYLRGESYAAVPVQFVPRLLYPDKPRSHAGTYILTKYYNLQTEEDTEVTTIDFGLVNEAYANFGYAGMAGLAVVLGCFFAAASRWARHMPILSFRAFFAVLVTGSVLQASSSASFYVATLFQSVVALAIMSFLMMRPMRPVFLQSSCLE